MTAKRRKYTRRIVLAVIIAVIGIHAVSALTLDRMMEYKEINFSSPRLPRAMNGYVIAFISDMHDMSQVKLAEIVERVNARDVDLLLLGGDYPDDDAAATMAVLSKVKTRDGVFGVGGNHDDYHDLARSMAHHSFTHLDNKGLPLKPGFYLAGVEYARHSGVRGDLETALSNASNDDFVLLLSHKPDIAMQNKAANIDLILSGHTHGGQVTFFGLWSPSLWPFTHTTNYGLRFMKGWAKGAVGNTNVYVSRGAGQARFSPRIFARPEVTFITLHATE